MQVKQAMPGILTYILTIYVLFALVMYLLQDRFVFVPSTDALEPQVYGLDGVEKHIIKTQDGVAITTWWKTPEEGFPTIVYFHGNAGHLGNRAYKFKPMTEHGFGIMAVSYRGYGASEGTPDEQGLYADARAAIHDVTAKKNQPVEKIILYGESLGSGVAVQMATEFPVGILVLEAPYTSVRNRAQEKFPFLPVGLMLRSHFDSIGKIRQVKAPLLLFHGEQDRVIPADHGRRLLQQAHEPKKGLFFPEYDHTNFSETMLANELLTYATEHGLVEAVSE